MAWIPVDFRMSGQERELEHLFYAYEFADDLIKDHSEKDEVDLTC